MNLLHFLKRRQPKRKQWDPDTPVLRLQGDGAITLGSLYSGTQIWGSTGSGKSSGPMAAICRGLFASGAGALCLCAKREDAALYCRYARECGRSGDVMLFGPTSRLLRFNAIESELSRPDVGGGVVTNVTKLLTTISEVSDARSNQRSGHSDMYFVRAAEQACRSCLEIILRAQGKVTIPDLQRFLASLPSSLDEVASREWQSSYCFQLLRAGERKPMSDSERADYELAMSYIMCEWAPMSGRTRSGILSTLTSTIDILSRGAVRDVTSCSESNVSPEMCWDGAIIVVDIPALVYGEAARVIGVILKYAWQRAAMRRDLSKGDRPCVILVDEAHLFAASPDWEFQTIARSSNTATVYATQGITNYLEVLGSDSEARVHSLLNNLQTQIFSQLSCTKTISYAQALFGKRRQLLMNGNTGAASGTDWLDPLFGQPGNSSAGFSETYEFDLQAHNFNSLRKGGPGNGFAVDGYLYQGGRVFRSTDRTWRPVTFTQTR